VTISRRQHPSPTVSGRAGIRMHPAWNRRLRLVSSGEGIHSVRRESGMEECGNTLGVQAPSEPLELSIIDHSMV